MEYKFLASAAFSPCSPSNSEDTLFLQNAAASTAEWGGADLSFHRMPDCSDSAMLFSNQAYQASFTDILHMASNGTLNSLGATKLSSVVSNL